MLTLKNLDPYQDEAVEFLYERDEALAFLPVGSGKTVIGATAFWELLRDGVVNTGLVVAPLRVAQLVWPEQLQLWEHLRGIEWSNITGSPRGWTEPVWAGTRAFWKDRKLLEQGLKAAQKKMLDEPTRETEELVQSLEQRLKGAWIIEQEAAAKLKVTRQLYITNYENVQWLCDDLDEMPWDLVIYDEISRFRDPKGERFKAIKSRTGEFGTRWGMTASPAPESLENLFTQVYAVDQGRRWGRSFYAWRKKFFVPIDFHGHKWGPQIGAEPLLYKDLGGLAFTVDEDALPEKEEPVARRIVVDPGEDVRKLYKKMERHLAIELDDVDIEAVNMGVLSGKLRQIAQGFIYDDDKVAKRIHSAKLDALRELVENLQGRPLMIGYDFIEDLERMRELWPGLRYMGDGVSKKEAESIYEDWNAGNIDKLAIHPASGGHGLNLQFGGHHLCWFGMPWSNELHEQLIGRIWRRGQEHVVFLHYIMATLPIDEIIWDAVADKASIQKALYDNVQKLRGG